MIRARALLLGAVAALAAAVLLVAGPAGSSPAQAADLREFDPGNIITDQVFFDTGAMSAAQVQSFLDAKGAGCTGTLCLRTYHTATFTKAPTATCPGGYQGLGSESAASIIWKVGQACGVNPQVLIVTLQKEMGFITSSGPTAKMYERAMGYGCPDSANGGCDAQYYGLQNQLYSAASQFQRYVTNPTRYSYRAGVVNNILYHPSNPCGRQSVFIQNGATAALYNYTPYVPNAAALAAGYGKGDSCSAYGNRNFFSYFTDWFGSTQSTGSGAINLKYMALGGAAAIGDPVAATQCGLPGGGCARAYAMGSIYWSPSSGAAYVTGPSLNSYWDNGAVGGPLGYPIADSATVPGGVATAFQGGSVYASPATGAHMVARSMLGAWWNSGGISGPLGFPIADSSPVAGGMATAFSGGSVYWSASSGAHWLAGPVLFKYWSTGVTEGPLGFPTSPVGAVTGGEAAAFQGGSIYSSAATGARMVAKDSLQAWWATGGLGGPLGWPAADSAALQGGRVTDFAGGSVYWSSATGAHVVQDDILAYYEAQGGPAVLGFPTADQGPVTGGTALPTQKASIYSSPSTGVHAVSGVVRSAWWKQDGITGPLGFPTADVTSVAGTEGLVGQFSGGSIYWSSPTGARVVRGDILAYYEAQGGPAVLGFPTADQGPVTGGTALATQQASIYSSPATGTHAVRGVIRSDWWTRGGITGPLGFPTTDVAPVAGTQGLVGDFSGGRLYWSSTTGTRLVQGSIVAYYDAQGGPAVLGFPTADQSAVTGGSALATQKVSIYASASTGVHSVGGDVRTAWWARGGITGPLGFPTGDAALLPGTPGAVGQFSGGSLYWSPATGAGLVQGDILAYYVAQGGPAALGFPIADQGAVAGGTALATQQVSIYSSPFTGAHVVRGAVRSDWWARGGISGPLGFPTSDVVAVTGAGGTAGLVGQFSGGTLYWSAGTGSRLVTGAVLTAYQAAGGPAGPNGWPTTDTYAVSGASRNDFQVGQITA